MAKQRGILKLSGTMGGMTFYKLGGRYYVRRKSSLDRRRVYQDPAFARSRASSRRFGHASMLAGHVYRSLGIQRKRCCTIGKLTAAACGLLQQGYSIPEAGRLLASRYLGPSATEMLYPSRVPADIFSGLRHTTALFYYNSFVPAPVVMAMGDDADTS